MEGCSNTVKNEALSASFDIAYFELQVHDLVAVYTNMTLVE
jgi:hypothetical protein